MSTNGSLNDDANGEYSVAHGAADLSGSGLAGALRTANARQLPKRFYSEVGITAAGADFGLLLDGRRAMTPMKSALAVPSEKLAESIAAEWRAQETVIDPVAMPLTTLTCTALDAVAANRAAVKADIVKYFGSDLLCYRAEGPDKLTARQCAHWDQPLVWANTLLGLDLVVTHGLMPVSQQPGLRAAADRAIGDEPALHLTALHVLTTLTGSAILALAVAHGELSLDEAWAAAHVDEDYQIELWGHDAEAAARRARRQLEARAAALVLELLPRTA